MKIPSKINGLRTVSVLTATILALPVPVFRTLTGIYLWFSPFLMLNSVISLRSFVWFNLLSVPILILITVHKRWFCMNLCPAGWSFDHLSGKNKRIKYSYKKIPEFGKLITIISITSSFAGISLFIFLDPLAIYHGFLSVFTGKPAIVKIILLSGFPILLAVNFFLPGVWCKRFCPLGGLQELIFDLREQILKLTEKNGKNTKVMYDPGRRYIIMSLLGLGSGYAAKRLFDQGSGNIIRPPASAPALLFSSLCCRCGNCIKSCPTRIVKYNTSPEDLFSILTPEISFNPGYCLEGCNICSRVCPTGAITLFDPKAKSQLKMGLAEISLENCRLVKNRECNKCMESCKYNAVEFNARRGLLEMEPVIDAQRCVGCGACLVICPENCILIRPV